MHLASQTLHTLPSSSPPLKRVGGWLEGGWLGGGWVVGGWVVGGWLGGGWGVVGGWLGGRCTNQRGGLNV